MAYGYALRLKQYMDTAPREDGLDDRCWAGKQNRGI